MATPYCLICHGIYVQTESIASTPCGHVYHNDCLCEWLRTSQTCPQCRENCSRSQLKRIYIDFACDEDLACSLVMRNTQPVATSSEAEETIKILLEHIEKPKLQPSHECDCCKMFQEALDHAQTEKEKMSELLGTREKENFNLFEEIGRASKRIEELEIELRESESFLSEMEVRLDTSETSSAALQSENTHRRDTIDYLKLSFSSYDDELKILQREKQELNDQLKKMTNKCKSFETEHSKMVETLEDKQKHSEHLTNGDQNSMKRIEELQSTIATKNRETQAMGQQVQELSDKLQGILDKHAADLKQMKKDKKRYLYSRFHATNNQHVNNHNNVPNENQNNQNHMNTQNANGLNSANKNANELNVPNNNRNANKRSYRRLQNMNRQNRPPNSIAQLEGEPSSLI